MHPGLDRGRGRGLSPLRDPWLNPCPRQENNDKWWARARARART
jgi:hypothetical protein